MVFIYGELLKEDKNIVTIIAQTDGHHSGNKL